jgi:hypothetical protein
MANVTQNRQVDVTALYFTNNNGRVKSFPKRIELDEDVFTFVESGLQILVQTAAGVVRIFEMTDGQRNFRLKNDQAHGWTLVSVK